MIEASRIVGRRRNPADESDLLRSLHGRSAPRFSANAAQGNNAMNEATMSLAAAQSRTWLPSAAYRRAVAITLMIVYALNQLDRQIVNILLEPIKRDFAL